nr:phage regulatory CII family protein [Caballeronia sp. dw_19]
MRNKVNLNRSPDNRNVLTLAEAVKMTSLTGDDRILEAWAQERGYALIEIPTADHCSDSAVLELMAKTWETNGDIGKEVNRTFEDNIVQQHEVTRIKDRVFTHIRALFGLVGRIEGMTEHK